MVKLRRQVHHNRINQISRLIWYGLLLLTVGAATLLISTNFIREPMLTSGNLMPFLLLIVLAVIYLVSWIRFIAGIKKQNNENQQ